jgi:hypothetical protein
MITNVDYKMRFVTILTIFTLPMNIQAMSRCHENCIEKERLRELVIKCNYLVHNFPEDNYCIPPKYYHDLYSNQTTFDDLREQSKYCKIQLAFIVVEMYFYLFVFVLLLIQCLNLPKYFT